MNRLFNRLSTQDKVMFAKRLSILVKAGNPLLESLRMLKDQASTGAAKRIYSQIVEDVERGQFLSSSLNNFKNIFGDFAVNVIRIGEMSGTLEGNLNYLAEELKKKQELKRKVVGAMIYPVIVLGATVALSVLLTVFIFPKILPIFESFKFDLPFTTRALIFISALSINYGFYILIGFVAVIVAFLFLMKTHGFRLILDGFVLRLPIFGRIAQSYYMANFCRTLGLLLKSQILVVEATRITGKTIKNKVYQKEIEVISEKVLRGEKISAHLFTKKKIFPSILAQMIAVGESTGSLSDTLVFISEMYENEVDMLTKNLSTLLEPVLMIIMGAVVGFIAISIITPIYELTQHINP